MKSILTLILVFLFLAPSQIEAFTKVNTQIEFKTKNEKQNFKALSFENSNAAIKLQIVQPLYFADIAAHWVTEGIQHNFNMNDENLDYGKFISRKDFLIHKRKML